MSWRAESTFKPSSKLVDEEKEYLKVAKKLRDILKLEDRAKQGETLDASQQEKVATREKLLKEITALAVKLPGDTEVLAKNQDITDMLPNSALQTVEKKRKQDQQARERKVEQEIKKKDTPEFMTRHDKPIVDVALSADGRHLFTCSKDYYVLCWSMKEKVLTVVSTLGGHRGAVFAVDAASGPYGVASGGADSIVHLWQSDPSKLRQGAVEAPMATVQHGGIVRVLRWCPFDTDAGGEGRRLASASEKLVSKPPAICVWRVSGRGKVEPILKYDDAKVLPGKANDLRWGGGAKVKLFSCHDNGYVGVWSVDAPGGLMKTLKLHKGPVMSLALSGDGCTLVTASHDATSAAVDVSSREMATLKIYASNRPLNAVCLSEDFKAGEEEEGDGMVALAGGKNARDVTTQVTQQDEFESKVMDAVSGKELNTSVKTHFGPVYTLLSLPGLRRGGAFASVSEDGCLKVHSWEGRMLHSDVIGEVE